jgi:uncharacterized protein DUF4296
MQKYKSLFFSLILFLCACGGISVPSGIIEPDRMVALLTEVHIADGSMYNTVQVPDSLYKYGTEKYLLIFKNFGTDSLQFKKSMKYYSNRPEVLVKIYDQVTTNLKQKSDSLNKITQQQVQRDIKRREDSLKKLPKQPPVQAQPVPPPPAKTPFVNKRYIPPVKSRRNVDSLK